MIKIIACGACGKMGTRIISLALLDKNIKVIAGIERKNHENIGKVINGCRIVDSLEKVVNETDCIIDFSNPESTMETARIAASAQKPLVIGSTGFTKEELDSLYRTISGIPVVMSPNMSIGVNVLFNIVREVAKVMSDYDVEIFEIHHNQKKDAPSGTANKLAEIICEVTQRNLSENGVYGRAGIVGARKKSELGILASRAGDVVGDHTVMFAANNERLELTHRAHSRDTLASGALHAARWVVNQKPGLYDMSDVLGLKAKQ